MADSQTNQTDLQLPIPGGYGNRLFLFAIRRMASGGVNDAHAANALLGAFGRSYRRPLVLMRAMMLEVVRASTRRILVAPCCSARMTADEGMLMHAVSDALARPEKAFDELTALMGNDNALGTLTCLQAVAQSHLDLGRPLSLHGHR